MVIDQKEALYLDREARRWATQVAREAKKISENELVLQGLQTHMAQLKVSHHRNVCHIIVDSHIH